MDTLPFELHRFGLQSSFVYCFGDFDKIKSLLTAFVEYFMPLEDAASRRLSLSMYSELYQYVCLQRRIHAPFDDYISILCRKKPSRWHIRTGDASILVLLQCVLPIPTSAKATLVALQAANQKLAKIIICDQPDLMSPELCHEVMESINEQVHLEELIKKQGVDFEICITNCQMLSDSDYQTDGMTQFFADASTMRIKSYIIWMMPEMEGEESVSTLYHEVAHVLLRMLPLSTWSDKWDAIMASGFTVEREDTPPEETEELLAFIIGNGLLLNGPYADHFHFNIAREEDKAMWRRVAKAHVLMMHKIILERNVKVSLVPRTEVRGLCTTR